MRVWSSGALMAWAPVAAEAQDGFEDVIRAQIDAFRRNDLVAAFEYASPAIQGLLGTPDRFGWMVQRGYPMVWRPGDLLFLAQRSEGGQYWQRVLIHDQSGMQHVLDYQMVQVKDDWRINAVQILPAQGVGA